MNTNSLGNRSQRLTTFLETVLKQEQPFLDEPFLERLHGYVAAQLQGEPYLALFPDVALALDRSPELAEIYESLYELEAAVQTGDLPQPAVFPAPNLDFLPGSNLLQLLRDGLERRGSQLRLQLSAVLLDLLQPPPQMTLGGAATTRQADLGRYGELLYTLDGSILPEPLPFSLNAYGDQEQPEFCLLEVEVSLADRSWPDLGGIPVTLEVEEKITTVETDAWGMAVFADIPLAELATILLRIEL